MRISKVYPRVIKIMQEIPESRNNDGLLTALVDLEINPEIEGMSYRQVMTNRSRLGLPPCESIRRSRQKAQETTPGLAGDKRIQKIREARREEMEDFVRRTH